MPATISDLAKKLQLSKGTVSRILNDKGEAFSPDTRRRVFEMAEAVGYTANPVARALATGHTGFIGLWMQDLLTSYHAQVAHFIEAHLESHDYRIAIALFGNEYHTGSEQRMTPLGVDGIIAHEGRIAELHRGGRVPIVSTGVYFDETCLDFVGVDLSGAAVEAVQHLVATGRRRIALLSNNIPARNGDHRYEAYCSVLGDSGLPFEFIDPVADSRANVRDFTRAYIQRNGCPDAIVCHNDDMAIAAYRALSELGRRIPDDVALMGCDGIEDTAYFPTSISTIAQPFEEMCETAWRYLQRRMSEPDAPPQRTILRPKLLLRESTVAKAESAATA